MARPNDATNPGGRWSGEKTLSFREVPDDIVDQFKATLPRMHGYSRRVGIALAAPWASSPPESRAMLLSWVDAANLDPSQRRPDDLAERFAESVVAHSEAGEN